MTRSTARHRAPVGVLCPDDPTHGPLLDIDGRPVCVHQSHDDARERPFAPHSPAVDATEAPRSSTEPQRDDSAPLTLWS